MNENPKVASNPAPSSSHCSTTTERVSKLGQVYGGAAAIRDLAESTSNIAGFCLEQRHVDDLQALAGMADRLCREIMGEWDVLAGKSLLEREWPRVKVPEHLLCENPGCDALHHQNENSKLPCPWKASW